jgi:hypothetical protein
MAMFLVGGNKTRPLPDVKESIFERVVRSPLKSYWTFPILSDLGFRIVDKFTHHRRVSCFAFRASSTLDKSLVGLFHLLFLCVLWQALDRCRADFTPTVRYLILLPVSPTLCVFESTASFTPRARQHRFSDAEDAFTLQLLPWHDNVSRSQLSLDIPTSSSRLGPLQLLTGCISKFLVVLESIFQSFSVNTVHRSVLEISTSLTRIQFLRL